MHLESIITDLGPTLGLIAIFAIIFAESGLLIGFFLPGDSLLFSAGFLASRGFLDIWWLMIGCFIAAVLGDSVGYAFGRRVGKRLFHRQDSVFFHKDNLEKAKAFYEKHGKKTIIIARFMPVVRTFAPIVAGIGDMHYRTFVTYNILGGLLWAVGLPIAGYFLGKLIPDVDKYLIPIVVFIVFISVAPSVKHLLDDPKIRKAIFDKIRSFLKK